MRLTVHAAAIAAALLAQAVAAEAQETVKLGVLASLTGAIAVEGAATNRGAELAAEQINQLGGIKSMKGAKFVLVVADMQSKPEIARSEADRLANQGDISAMIGAGASGSTLPAMQVADKAKIPFVIPSAIADSLTDQGLKYVFRIASKSQWYAEDAVAFVQYLKQNGVDTSKIGLVYEDGVFGQGVIKIYKDQLPAKGFNIVEDVSFRTGLADLTTQVAKLKAAGATIVLSAVYPVDTVVLLRAMTAREYKPYTIGIGAGHITQTTLQAGAVAERTFGLVDWSVGSPLPAAQAFEEAFRKKYDQPPSSGAAESFVATWMVALAAEKAGSRDPNAIRDALASLKVTDGPAAILPQDAIAFGPDGQNNLRNSAVEILDNKFVPVWPEKFAAHKFVPVQ